MAAQNKNKKLFAEISSRSYEDYQKIQKQRPKSDFKTSSTVNFPKKHPDFGGLETNQRD